MGGPPPLGDLGPPQPGGAQQNGTGGEEVAGQRHQQLSQLLQSKANHGSPKEQLVGGGPKLLGGPLLNGPPMGQPRPPQSLGALLGPNSPHQGGPSGMGAPAMKVRRSLLCWFSSACRKLWADWDQGSCQLVEAPVGAS